MTPPLTWTAEPSVIVGIVAASVWYGWSWRRARRPGMPHPPGLGRLALFVLSMLVIILALLSPVDAVSDDMLSVHMVQHLLLIDVFPVIFILSLTKGVMRPITRKFTAIERRAGPVAHPVFALCLYCGMMGFWHIPHMYDLAVRNGDIHVLEHTCFVVAGMFYWWHLLSPIRARMALRGMASIIYMGVSKFWVGMLGIILAFAPHSIYPWYSGEPHWFGLSATIDQNLAGAIMMVEQSLLMGAALAYVIMRMLGDSERQEQRNERQLRDDAAWVSYRAQLAEHRAKQAR